MTRIAFTAAAVAALSAGGTAAAADPAEGVWLTPGGQSKVQVAPCRNDAKRLCGNIVWLKNPKRKDGSPVLDGSNPDPKLRTRPILGLSFITGFRRDAPGRWSGGKIYNPSDGKTYASKLSIQPDGTLKVEGCVLVVCRGQTWTRTTL